MRSSSNDIPDATADSPSGAPAPSADEAVRRIVVPELPLERGGVLYQVPVVYRTWGTLNAAADNAVVVCHALTGDVHVDAWWGPLLAPGGALDPADHFIVAANVLGSPYGTASPLTTNPATGQPYGPDFPEVTIRDTVRAHRYVLDHLGVQQVACAIGGSMGGMQVLEWAFEGDFVRSLVPVAVGGRHSAWCIGWSEAQRQAIYADPKWQGGAYPPDDPPVAGLSAARMSAMVSYRSRASFAERFGRDHMDTPEAPFAVESYLRYQGQKLADRFDPACYVELTRQMDSHDVARGRGAYRDVLRQIAQPTLVVGIDSDVLYPLEEQEELVEHLPNAELAVLSSPHGHDAFLIALGALNAFIRSWQQRTPAIQATPTFSDVRSESS